jgi:cytochrome oxidase assembly protein ShyY1
MPDQDREALLKRREELKEELAQAQAAMPAHSVRPWQLQRLEDAEEALAEVEARLKRLEDG